MFGASRNRAHRHYHSGDSILCSSAPRKTNTRRDQTNSAFGGALMQVVVALPA